MAWDDVDLEKGTIHLKETKTGIKRYVQLPEQAVTYLKSMRMNSDKYLFPSQVTKLPIQQKYLTECAWRLRKEGKMPDIPDWSPHDLRRTLQPGVVRYDKDGQQNGTVMESDVVDTLKRIQRLAKQQSQIA